LGQLKEKAAESAFY
jgi:hypothetical protein